MPSDASHTRPDSHTRPVPGPTRRAVLAAGACGAGAMALAACGSSGNGTSAGPQGSAQGSQPSSGPMTLATFSQVAVGSAISVPGPNGTTVIVARTGEQTAVAFSARCTHMGCTVAVAGDQLICPCHHSTYDALTGRNTGGPAPRPLDPVAVTVFDGTVSTA